ncbi:hypothetical protein [Fusobacterium ulcerans]|uniref:Uncharacterized protein n=1 Tax=Fusobacterium ulcerans 12-1B TaxID=457404 RepID=H1PTU4_9FUSO|nr:hypothetical protein [Fusobacterium ulcerans]EHO80764.2 hypothetical protein HMPREF0402_01837 [Fusobacterium ulcerans 12-1B]
MEITMGTDIINTFTLLLPGLGIYCFFMTFLNDNIEELKKNFNLKNAVFFIGIFSFLSYLLVIAIYYVIFMFVFLKENETINLILFVMNITFPICMYCYYIKKGKKISDKNFAICMLLIIFFYLSSFRKYDLKFFSPNKTPILNSPLNTDIGYIIFATSIGLCIAIIICLFFKKEINALKRKSNIII